LAAGGGDVLAVGVPVGRGGAFFEVYPLAGLSAGLATLWPILALTTCAAALVGLWVGQVTARRLRRPLDRVSRAASAIARGDLTARLDPEADPDLAEIAHSFNRTAAALEERVRADARFAGDVSHELRTPLTTMLNSMEIIQNRWADVPPALWEPLELLAGDLHRFRRLVVDLLDISRPEGGDESAAREPVLIGELVRRAADEAAHRQVTVIEPAAGTVVLQGDKRRLQRVVTNLVENAEVHGGGCVRVGVRLQGRSVLIEVDDHGPGVPEHLRTRIFERFTRDDSHDDGGVGLGLAIVAWHVRWHGGVVRAGDAPAGGARFTVELPMALGVPEVRPADRFEEDRERADHVQPPRGPDAATPDDTADGALQRR
jgi:signal transduction histidine kinase